MAIRKQSSRIMHMLHNVSHRNHVEHAGYITERRIHIHTRRLARYACRCRIWLDTLYVPASLTSTLQKPPTPTTQVQQTPTSAR